MFERIVVTGGSGFIGSALIRKLLIERNSIIYNIDKKNPSDNAENIERKLNQNIKLTNRYKLCTCNLIEFESLKKIIFDIKPDLIINLAAETHVDRSIDDPKNFLQSNILGTYNLIEIIRNYLKEFNNNKFKLIHVSTDEVFGSLGKYGQFKEDSPYKPNSPYSASKAASDHLVKAWYKTYSMPFIVTNCSNNYGPWQFPEKLIPLVIMKALKNEKIPIYGDGMQIRDWLHVSDHVEALVQIAEKGVIGKNYCIGGNSEMTNLDTINLICEYLDKINPKNESHKNLITFVEDRPGHDSRYAIDASLLKNEIGWVPKVAFEDGLRQTLKWYIDNQQWCENVLKESNYNFQRLGLQSFIS